MSLIRISHKLLPHRPDLRRKRARLKVKIKKNRKINQLLWLLPFQKRSLKINLSKRRSPKRIPRMRKSLRVIIILTQLLKTHQKKKNLLKMRKSLRKTRNLQPSQTLLKKKMIQKLETAPNLRRALNQKKVARRKILRSQKKMSKNQRIQNKMIRT